MKFFSAVFLTAFLCGVASADSPSVHGMLVFGKSKTYLSHLPMFHNPHDYQWVMEVEFPTPVLETKNLECETLCTLVPQPFELPKVAEGKLSFFATLYKGHFERGGQPISRLFQVKITQNLVFKKFDGQGALNTAYVIGDEKEKFLIHSIVKAPDFDQVLELKTLEVHLHQPGTARAVKVGESSPLKPFTSVSINEGTRLVQPLEIGKEVYLEEGELQH